MPSRKQTATPEEKDLWGSQPIEPEAPVEQQIAEVVQQQHQAQRETVPAQYDLEGLMTDFPTAKELERFVFDETGIVLNLKGRANKLKYQTAMDVLNGVEVDPNYIGSENPYVDKADMVPVEEVRDPPARDPSLPSLEHVQNSFHSRQIPHPDTEYRNQGKRCDVTFRKYDSGVITYEIMGPIDQRPHGEKIDKFGRIRPEIIKWVDPRSGEQIIQRVDGSFTPMGKRLRALMMMKKVNHTNFWDVWVDREFMTVDSGAIANPWAAE
jgi:hypothetical protein